MKIRHFCLLVVGSLLFTVPSWAQGYRATIIGLVPASAATDIMTLTPTGSTKVVSLTKVIITCNQTTAGSIDINFLTRSTADTSGTSTSPTVVPMDPQNPGTSATVKAYTVNPTTGTLIGSVATYKLSCLGTATASPQDIVIENFGYLNQSIVLRGTASQFAVNLNAQTVTGGSFDITFEWREN